MNNEANLPDKPTQKGKGKEEEHSSSSEEEEDAHPVTDSKTGPSKELRNNPVNTIVGPVFEYIADPENVPLHPSIVSFGKRRSGKSTSMDNWFFHCIQDVPFGLCITRTKGNGFWQTRIPERFVFQGFREDVLIALLDRQRKMIAEHGKENPATYAFCVLDDVIADQRQIRYTPALNTFFVEGRHLNISVFITSQNIKGVGPMIRGNCDLVFVQPIFNIREREAVWELYAGFMDKKTWFQLMDEVIYSKKLEGHTPLHPRLEVQIMVVQDFDQTPDPSEKFFWWKPVHSDALPNYRLLHPIYWKEDLISKFNKQKDAKKKERPHPVDVLDQCRSVLTGGAPSFNPFSVV